MFLLKRAENGTRTRDPNLGKVVLYQLSYFRITILLCRSIPLNAVAKVRLFSDRTKNLPDFFRTIPPFSLFQSKSVIRPCTDFGGQGRKVTIDKSAFVPRTDGVCTRKGRQSYARQRRFADRM